MVTLKQIQSRLLEKGYDPGPIDGIPGRLTTAAIKKFQIDKKLSIKYLGTVGPKTLNALGLLDPVKNNSGQLLASLPWIDFARNLIDLHEVRDGKKLDKILKLNTREIPWCGALITASISSTLSEEPIPSNPFGARNWLKFGKKVDEPTFGAVTIFWRVAINSWQGHVGYTVGQDKTHLHILGGNQNNMVNISRIAKNRVLGYRVPNTYEYNITPLNYTTINATITNNEA